MRVVGLSQGFFGLVGFFSFVGGGLVLMDWVGWGLVGLESKRFVSLVLRCLVFGVLNLAGLDFFGWHSASLEVERPKFSGCFAKNFMVNPILLLATYTTVSCCSH